ncbi:SCAN domain-containing protein 3-like [Xyrauchen texanus]|uniref:SCAN domain-containing protein 3-like n=1 Tax=Xyrauchen texanus TaxID=154827 RepID=UPI0022419FA3|nr:SCAN domain-containing protein 3-like [Xyrauchen texanus]
MKPAHLQRHLSTKHQCPVGKPPEFRSSQETMRKVSTTSAKALQASYAVSLLVAKAKKPFTIAEDLLLPAAVVLAETMLDKNAADKLKTVPLSNDTVSRRIERMGAIIVEQVVGKPGEAFSLQLDESTDVSGKLIAFVRYVDIDDIYENVLFCKSLDGKTTGEDLFNVVDNFFIENELDWRNCKSVCTDGAASITGRVKGFMARIRNKHPEVQWNHCVIHREALASKNISPVLHDVLNDSIKVINFIKSRPLNARLFHRLCEDMGAEHTQLLLHTEVCWLSRGRILNRLLELRAEVHTFLSEQRSPYATLFEDIDWLAKLCYLADIFSKLNELNVCLQGKDTHILNLYDKVGGFLKKAELWKWACVQGDLTCFSQVDAFLSREDVERAPVKSIIEEHLANLIVSFNSYFPDMEGKSPQLSWVRNPFLLSEESRKKLPLCHQEKLLDVSSDYGLRMKYENSTLAQF